MKLGSPVRMTRRPLRAPIATATRKATRIALQTGQPHWTERIAMTTPEKPIIEPTERSNSPAIIRRHAPTAMIANWAETTVQFITPWRLNMPESRAMAKKNTKTRIAPQMEPSSGRTRAERNRDLDLRRSSSAAMVIAASPLQWVGG